MSSYVSAPQIISAAWIVFLLYWIVASRGRNKVERRQPRGERLRHIAFMTAGFILLFSSDLQLGRLNARFVPSVSWIEGLGVALTFVGIAFAIWARRHIRKNWSSEVTIRAKHQLIRTGPYSHIRHPIYTGMLAALIGTALVVGEVRAIVALIIFVLGFTNKARKEELFLSEQFGKAFEEHKRSTGFFLPRLT